MWVFSESYGTDEYVLWRAGQNRHWERVVLTGQGGSEKLVVVRNPPPPAALKAGVTAPRA